LAEVKALEALNKSTALEIDGKISLGASLERGNTHTSKLNLDGELKVFKLPHTFKFFIEARFETDNEKDITDNSLFNMDYSYFITENWYLFTKILFRRDEFKDLTYQGIYGIGPGYQIWKSFQKNLSVSIGPGFVTEDYDKQVQNFENTDERDYWAGIWSLNFDIWLFDRILQVYYRNWGVLSMEDNSVWQVINRLGFRLPVVEKLFFNIVYSHDYDNFPADGKKNTDSKLALRLGVDF
jgi:putative salt-induced outer membrane protein YdiY